jgi:hypothetical protein
VKLNLHDPKVRRRVLIGAGAALLALLFARHKGAPSSTAAAPVGTDPGIDPATGIPYALEAQDPGLGPGGAGLGVTAADPGTADPGPAGPVGPAGPAGAAGKPGKPGRRGKPGHKPPQKPRIPRESVHHPAHPGRHRHPTAEHPHAQHHTERTRRRKPRVKPKKKGGGRPQVAS